MLKLQFKDNPSRGFWLVGEQLTLGTDGNCNVVLEGLGINALHATITINGDDIQLSPSDDSPCYVNAPERDVWLCWIRYRSRQVFTCLSG